jgi:hypothetical protein
MTHPQHPPRIFFGAKTLKGTYDRGPDGPIEIEVETPDLSDAPAALWGDWGPMVTCTLASDERVTVRYTCARTRRSATYQIAPRSIGVNSPRMFARRKTQPFYLEVVDVARGLRLRGYMNADGECVELEADPIAHDLDCGALCLAGARNTMAA